jgi:hypothetical protein
VGDKGFFVISTGTLQEPHPSLILIFGVVGNVEEVLNGTVLGVLLNSAGFGVSLNTPGPFRGVSVLDSNPCPLVDCVVSFVMGEATAETVLGVVDFSALPGAVEINIQIQFSYVQQVAYSVPAKSVTLQLEGRVLNILYVHRDDISIKSSLALRI